MQNCYEARASEVSMEQVLGQDLEQYLEQNRRRQVLEATNAAYAVLQKSPAAWAELLEERAEWDLTLIDGLDGV